MLDIEPDDKLRALRLSSAEFLCGNSAPCSSLRSEQDIVKPQIQEGEPTTPCNNKFAADASNLGELQKQFSPSVPTALEPSVANECRWFKHNKRKGTKSRPPIGDLLFVAINERKGQLG